MFSFLGKEGDQRTVQMALAVCAALILCGCSVSKNLKKKDTKTDTTTITTETGTVITKREGDTLSYTILNPVLKDTTIYVKNYQKENSNQLRIIYDQAGAQTIDCISPALEEIRNYLRQSEENKKQEIEESDRTKETVFKPVFILYIFLGFAGLIVLVKVLTKLGL